MPVRPLTSSQAHPASVERPASMHSAKATARARSRLPAGTRLRPETMCVMRFLAPASAAGLIWCCLPAAGQTAVESAGTPVILGVPAGLPEVARWHVEFAPYALHFSGDSNHKPVVLLGLERERPDGIIWGGSVFSNSFGQPSAYVYGGQSLYRW